MEEEREAHPDRIKTHSFFPGLINPNLLSPSLVRFLFIDLFTVLNFIELFFFFLFFLLSLFLSYFKFDLFLRNKIPSSDYRTLIGHPVRCSRWERPTAKDSSVRPSSMTGGRARPSSSRLAGCIHCSRGKNKLWIRFINYFICFQFLFSLE